MSRAPVAIIVQCRLRSSRLPGKALMPIVKEMSILEFLLRRLQLCKNADSLILTTGSSSADDPIAAIAAKLGVPCVRGPEDDVLERFVLAADVVKAQTIVRVCADNPLTDPFLIDDMIELYQSSPEIDHLASFAQPSVPYGVGCAIFSREVLDQADEHCNQEDPSREHVEPFMLDSTVIKTHHYVAPPELHCPDLQVTVDRQRDYDFVQPIAATLHRRFGLDFRTKDLVRLVSKPKLALFANGLLGLEGARFLRKVGASVAALVLHPEDTARHRKEIIGVFDGEVEDVIDYTSIFNLTTDWFEEKEIDIVISLWSSYIFKRDLIERIPLGIFNLHNSLLPGLGGCGANIWAILLNVTSGATLHRVTSQIDRGPILEQRPLASDWSETGGSLFLKQNELMVEILKDRWPDLPLGKYDYLNPVVEPSYFSKNERDKKKVISLDAPYTARDLFNRVRAYQFGTEDAAYFLDDNGELWDVKMSITRRARKQDF